MVGSATFAVEHMMFGLVLGVLALLGVLATRIAPAGTGAAARSAMLSR